MEKKLRGGDLRGPACLGQPPSLAWVAPGSPNESAPPRPRGPLPHRVAGVSSPDLNLTVASLQRFSAALRVSTHLNTASKALPGDPGHLTSISPANPLPPLCPVVLLSLLWTPPPPTLSTLQEMCFSPSSPGYILLVMWVSPELRCPLFEEAFSHPKGLSSRCSPNMPTFPYNSRHHMVSEWPV